MQMTGTNVLVICTADITSIFDHKAIVNHFFISLRMEPKPKKLLDQVLDAIRLTACLRSIANRRASVAGPTKIIEAGPIPLHIPNQAQLIAHPLVLLRGRARSVDPTGCHNILLATSPV